MRRSDVNDVLQLAASIGVIIGLVLVMYEIRETNKIAENQAAIDMNSLYNEWTMAMMDEDMADLWLKSLDSPNELTRVDLIRLRYAYLTALQTFETNHFLWESGGLRMYRKDSLYQDAARAFSSDVGERYIIASREDDESEVAAILRRAVSDSTPEGYLMMLDNMVPPMAIGEETD